MIDPIVRAVLSLMGRHGGTATLVVDTGESSYDPATSKTVQAVKEYRVKVLAQDYIQKTSGIMSQTGGLVQTGDKCFFIQPAEGVPAPRPGVDYLIYEGKRWTAISLKDNNPSGTKSYLYEVYARQ